ncbi:hypothetical protein EJV47_06650 [Hymenobacter gummosus]|uniref:Uncharacterized protein n=1 Tax=Hymenobacter gummosus TaxID=1776032 RepID=A0A3S0H6P4_9BACT|nr:hypothetical protein [Hymenobacter gummosus]RTQ51476.1 hypothetical protein EJV47_06650 [Hymenobacter gummosus]
MDDHFLALGFERWTSQLPLQTTMYVHAHAACDGARLYLAIPRTAPTPDAADEYRRLAETVERFFRKHGGRQPAPLAERPSSLLA